MATTGPNSNENQAGDADSYLTQYTHPLITSPTGQFVKSPRGTNVNFVPNAEIDSLPTPLKRKRKCHIL